MKTFISILVLLSIITVSIAQEQEQELNNGVKGIWYKPDASFSLDWEAKWIWMNDSIFSDVMLTRKTFILESLPKKAILHITATSQYQLFINGEYVLRGPARSAPHHQSFDVINIKNLLQKGRNLIAVRVHYQNGKKSYYQRTRPGLLTQLEISSIPDNKLVISDSTWKVLPDFSWDPNAPKINRFQQVVNDRVDMRDYPQNWKRLGFSDTKWSNATPLRRNIGWPSPQLNAGPLTLVPPWTSLVPRNIPYLLETDTRPFKLIQAEQVQIEVSEQPSNFKSTKISEDISEKLYRKKLLGLQKGTDTLVIPASDTSKSWFLLWDFGKVLNGMPKLHIKGAAGTKISIISAPFIVDNEFTGSIVDSNFRDQIILSGEMDIWESTYFKPIRYMGILIQNGKHPIKIYDAGIHQLIYPFEEKGRMRSADAPWVEEYFEASAKTIKVATTDAYTDNYRERRQYAQTGFYASLGNYWIFGDKALQRRYLVQISEEQMGNGIMPAYAPLANDEFMVILDSNSLWIRGLYNYFLYSGDKITTKKIMPAAKKLMSLLNSYTNSEGLIDNPPFAYWLDHALIDRRGANFILNSHYLGALEDFAKILEWFNETESEIFRSRAELLRSSLQKYFWDKEKNLFTDALIGEEKSTMYSEQTNGMALAMNIATKKQGALIAEELLAQDDHNYITRAAGMTMVTPATSYFLHKGLCDYGYIEESFQLFRKRFDKMIDGPGTNGTLWEEWWLDATGRTGKIQKGRTRSDAQTESAFPPALFAKYLLGIKPVKPGMKEIIIGQTQSFLKNIEAKVPSPEGILSVKWNLSNDQNELDIEVPGEMLVKIDISSLQSSLKKELTINGEPFDNDQNIEYLKFQNGSYKILY